MVQGTSPGAPMGTMPRRELPPCPGPITTCVTSRRQSPLHARNTHGGPRYPISRSTKSLTVPPLEGVGDGGGSASATDPSPDRSLLLDANCDHNGLYPKGSEANIRD
ncbi:hypothetical protein PCL_11770 [Purpureocillium lilacinum]|uniref:Uncharacterized protein n=1 Tax=Purpureocillium lilacinum TaxID=33203 RepID=A0A2U3EAY1_PURLI|nr:hypothetical protein Purlil1_6391 [Purpureocillium lilacinum]PWI71676.1 hypothetical protein PCL_11770 [Purpureocillium lilacinum]